MPRGLIRASLLVSLLALARPAHAVSLQGDTITGTLNFCTLNGGYNEFTPDSGTAPYSFEFVDGSNDDTAVFSGTELTVQDEVTDTACGWGMSFTDTTTPFPALTLLSDTFAPDITYSLAGGVIAITWPGETGPGTFTAVFNIDGELPEPASLPLFAVGLVGLELFRRWRVGAPR